MAIFAGAGSKLFIGTTAVATDQASYEADTYVEVEQTESLGDFGDNSAEVTFTGLGDARVQKLKGSRDAGNLTPTMALDIAGAGQAAMVAASEDSSSANYNYKITSDDDAITWYFSGQTSTMSRSISGADNIVMVNGEVRINTAILEVITP